MGKERARLQKAPRARARYSVGKRTEEDALKKGLEAYSRSRCLNLLMQVRFQVGFVLC